MAPSPKTPAPTDDSLPLAAVFRNSPWWIFLLLGASGGGGLGTLLSRPVFADGSAIRKEEVQTIVDEAITRNNDVLMQRIELVLARQKLDDAGLSAPSMAGHPIP